MAAKVLFVGVLLAIPWFRSSWTASIFRPHPKVIATGGVESKHRTGRVLGEYGPHRIINRRGRLKNNNGLSGGGPHWVMLTLVWWTCPLAPPRCFVVCRLRLSCRLLVVYIHSCTFSYRKECLLYSDVAHSALVKRSRSPTVLVKTMCMGMI